MVARVGLIGMNLYPEIVIHGIIAAMEEGERLKTLSNQELVNEYFLAEDDDLIVMEMCERLHPSIAETGH
jgi:hypothetical protein